MTDRELLEQAAKAAGITPPGGQGGYVQSDGGFCYYLDCEGKTARIWNPLTDDGDALRLAVKLRIEPIFYGELFVSTVCNANGEERVLSKQAVDGDPYAATRRAIVRAAAEIARERDSPSQRPLIATSPNAAYPDAHVLERVRNSSAQ